MNDNLVLSPGYILLTPEKAPETKITVVNEAGKEDHYVRGLVLSVGPSYFQEDIELKPPCNVGDSILFTDGGYNDYQLNGKIVKIIRFSQVIGVFNATKN